MRIFFILLLMPIMCFADIELDYSFLKKNDSETLGYWLDINDRCKVDKERVKSSVEGVIVRSRIKPVHWGIWERDQISLTLKVDCLDVAQVKDAKNDRQIFFALIYFSKQLPKPAIHYADTETSYIGVGSTGFVEGAIKQTLERALIPYIKVNFLFKS